MRNLFILFVPAFLLMLGSCSIISYKSASVESDYVAKNGFMMAKPQLVDIEVEKRKIEGTATVDNKLYGGPAATDAAKNLAVMDAVKRGNADILVQPVFEIESNGTSTTARVRGFAGRYKEFRDITVADTTAFWLRKRMDNYASDMAVPSEVSVTKKGR